jgi:hypothetical protein
MERSASGLALAFAHWGRAVDLARRCSSSSDADVRPGYEDGRSRARAKAALPSENGSLRADRDGRRHAAKRSSEAHQTGPRPDLERNQGGSNVKLTVENLFATDDHVAYTLTCTLPDGRRIVSNSILDIRDDQVARDLAVQAREPE